MSLFTNTGGTPASLHSLICLLALHADPLDFEAISGWLTPPREDVTNLLEQTIGCATSLGFVVREGNRYRLTSQPLINRADFLDEVHRRLASAGPDNKDREVFAAYTAILLRVDRNDGTAWLAESTEDTFSDVIRDDLAGSYTFNKYRITPFRRWVQSVGLGWELDGEGHFFPDPTRRIRRELPVIARSIKLGDDLTAGEFLKALVRKMPYLDGGELYRELSQKTGFGLPAGQLGRVFSAALVNLHDEGMITLKQAGDAAGTVMLAPDVSHAVSRFSWVQLNKERVG